MAINDDDDKMTRVAKFLLGWLDYGTPEARAEASSQFKAPPKRVDPFAAPQSNFPLSLGAPGAAAPPPNPESVRFLTQADAVQQQQGRQAALAAAAQAAQRRQVPIIQQGQRAGIAQPVDRSTVPPGGETMFDQFAKQRAGYMKQMEQEYEPPDYSQLQAQMRQRAGGAMPAMAGAILAGLGPRQVAGPLQQSMLKIAEEARAPMKVEGGTIDSSGRVLLDPGFQRQRKIEFLTKRIEALDKLEAGERDKQRAAALADAAARDRNALHALIAQGQQDTRMMVGALAKGLGGGDNWQAASGWVDKQGRPVVMNKQGQMAVATAQGLQPLQGQPQRLVEPTAGERDKLVSAGQSRDTVAATTKFFDDYTKKGGPTWHTGILPGMVESIPAGSALMAKVRDDPLFSGAREQMFNAITDFRLGRTGVTLTTNEYAESARYLPSVYDGPQELARKGKDFQKWQSEVIARKMGQFTPGALPPGTFPGGAAPAQPGGRNYEAEYGLQR